MKFFATSTQWLISLMILWHHLRTLTPLIKVRILVPQPKIKHLDDLRKIATSTNIYTLAAISVFCGISGCGQDGEKLPSYSPEARKWTAYGDSTMVELGTRWQNQFADAEPIANYGISGSTIDLFLAYPDPYPRDRVIIMSGVNNLCVGQSVDQTVAAYWELLLTLKANRIYCVSLSPTASSSVTNDKILAVNEAIRGMCGEDYYIESWDLYDPTDSLRDGLHHTDAFDRRIMDEILRRDAALPDV